ncbi:TOM1-like protein 1 isoform X2 [Heptranchias perlo]|uniref:TOM1-like protein 1 isoform X2 n=1 Tax=Heptranchias perlo TaxID=212740 RepID=UPI0035599EAF
MAFGKPAKDPFSTGIGKLIDKATIGTLQTGDWGQFIHICNIINATEEGPKDAVKALKKRIAGNRNYKEIRLALSLLVTCMRNCGPSFHSLIVRKVFVKDVLAKVLKPKYNPPIDIQNHILTLIQSWATTYQGPIDVSDVQELYMEMKRKGLIFPTPAVGSTGTRNNGPVAVQQPHSSQTSPISTSSVSSSAASLTPCPRNTITLVPEQVAKLRSELDMVTMNITVMSAILVENVPGSGNPEDMEMLQKLHQTCRSMQDRIVALLLEVENEGVIGSLLQANDELNSVFLRYERFERRRASFGRRQESAESTKGSVTEASAPCCTHDLIDFSCSAPALAVPVPASVTHFSSVSLNGGNSAAMETGQCATNPFLQTRALPELPVPNAVPVYSMAAQSQVTESLSEPLYANIFRPRSVQALPPDYSLLSGSYPTLTAATSVHTGANQPNPPEITGAEMITMEFDPLTNTDYNAEAIYEDLDVALNKDWAQHNRDC